MAVYYAQIKDTETQTMFQRIRLRAWRRIGELFSAVDLSQCSTQVAKVKAIRAAFAGVETVNEMKDYTILNVMKLMAIPNEEFDCAIQQQVNGSIDDLIRRTPTWEKQRDEANRKAGWGTWGKSYKEAATEDERREIAKVEMIHLKHEAELEQAATTAMAEVGITLERKDRANMKQVVFLIKDEVHSVMRQAAFDKHITMQELLRRGLKLWLEANGYDLPDDVHRQREEQTNEDARMGR